MKKRTKAIAFSLAASMMIAPIAATAKNANDKVGVEMVKTEDVKEKAQYSEFNGKIKSVDLKGDKGSILVEGENENLLFHISEDVLVTDMRKTMENKMMHLKDGAEIVAFYPVNTPVTMSIPGQLTPEVIVIKNDESMTSKVDIFDENLVSSDNTLKLLIEDEEGAKGFANKRLLVLYSASTRSIPAQTSPESILVLDKKDVEIPEENTPEVIPPRIITNLNEVVVNGRSIKMNLYRDGDATMVPVRDIAEALEYKLVWNGKEKPIELTKGAQWTQITLNKNSYSFARMAAFELEKAPSLKNGSTYVPASFIERVLQADLSVVDGVLNIK